MKKLLTVSLFFVLIFSLFACAENEAKEKTPEGAFSTDDLFITVDGVKYTCGVYMDTIIANLGENYNYSEAISCAYDGMDKTFEFVEHNLTFYTRPDGDRDVVTEIYTTDESVISSREVTSTLAAEDVRAAYGEPDRSTSIMDIYRITPKNDKFEGASLYFEYSPSSTVVAVGVTDEVPIYE